jgi:NADH-quinone oxidoreductase subunit M
MMLIPMSFLIGIWGHENRANAAIKFFIFTQASGLLMLVAIVALVAIHHQHTGVYTFNYTQLLGTPLSASAAMWLMLGFFVAFAVKLPVVPLHTWLPEAHTQAPTAGSVILAGLLLKTGAYGLLRFVVPFFPEAAQRFAPVAMVLGVIGIVYGAIVAFAQTDIKRLVAYTSVSHMGFVLLGIFAWQTLALQGAVMQMICHGLSTGALFILAGALQHRLHTRDMGRMGGLWATLPRMGGIGVFLAMASLGLPGLGNFVAEFLILIGAFQEHAVLAIVATVGLVTATLYALRMVQRTFYGPPSAGEQRLPDFSMREMAIMGIMVASLVGLGLYPQPVLDTAEPVLNSLQQYITGQLSLPGR